MMKTAVFLVFLAFSLALCYQDAQNSGHKRSLLPCQKQNNKALANLVGNGKSIQGKLSVLQSCSSSMTNMRTVDRPNEVHYDFEESCYVEGDSQSLVKVKAKSDPPARGGEQCAVLPVFQAAFLVQDVDTNSYMILNPATAQWFFTRPLGGCEMFVAKGSSRQDVLVIHSNLDRCRNKVGNLQEKGASVDEMMGRHPGYHLIARVYSEPPAAEKPAADAYMRGYERGHPGILTIAYNNQPPTKLQYFQFIGHYNDAQYWIFTVKGEIDGKVFGRIQVR